MARSLTRENRFAWIKPWVTGLGELCIEILIDTLKRFVLCVPFFGRDGRPLRKFPMEFRIRCKRDVPSRLLRKSARSPISSSSRSGGSYASSTKEDPPGLDWRRMLA